MKKDNSDNDNLVADVVFEYHRMRLVIGSIALLIPWITWLAAMFYQTSLFIPTSISVTYHLGAQTFFVGMLAIVGAFLFAYKGHSKPKYGFIGVFQITERKLSFIASFSALIVAVFPTSVDKEWLVEANLKLSSFPKYSVDEWLIKFPKIFECSNNKCNLAIWDYAPLFHIFFAILLFIVLCTFSYNFYKRTGNKLENLKHSTDENKRQCIPWIQRRHISYKIILSIMILAAPSCLIIYFTETVFTPYTFLIAEVVILQGFGACWFVSGYQRLRGDFRIELDITKDLDGQP